MKPIISAIVGLNADIFPSILKLHVPPGSIVADVTYGKENFWKKVHLSKHRLTLLKTDIKTGIDLRALPYNDASLDALVLDPPYRQHSPSSVAHKKMDACYNVSSVNGPDEIRQLYIEGSKEAWRVLNDNAILIVKCQDEIIARKQIWNHIELLLEIEKLGYVCVDLFVLVRKSGVIVSHNRQFHAAKNHSYFLVFRKGKGLGGCYAPDQVSLINFTGGKP